MDLLSEFKNYLLSQKNPSSKLTVKNYICDVRKFVAWFEARFKTAFSPSMVTLEIIETFKEENPNLSTRSLDRCLSTFRKFFNFLLLEGVIESNPLDTKYKIQNTNPDYWHIKEFKDYLYVYNASTLTIKNYLADIKSFLNWVENVAVSNSEWDIKAKNLFNKINNEVIEEYKQRIMPTNEAGLSPATVNRKLSSLRKYITWAEEKGYIDEKPQISNLESQQSKLNLKNLEQKQVNQSSNTIYNYSSFPPFRLIQKTKQAMGTLLEAILVDPLAFTVKGFEYLTWKIKGRPVFMETQSSKLKIKSLPKEFYAPLLISTKNFSFYKKFIFSLRHNRPKWYKIYHSYALSHYLHFAILVMIMSAIGFGLYQNLNEKPLNRGVLGIENPKSPPRIFSFQGKLTDSSGNPITSATSLRFAIYNSLTGTGSALMWQEVNTVTPDSDGIFSVLLGNGSTMQQNMFAEHAGLWLGVSVGKTAELTPRQQLATVAFAQNSDTLEGLPPITNSDAGTKNVVLALDSSGNLTIGGTATPTFQATGGQLTLSGNILLLTTLAGGNSDIIASPSGIGKIDLNKPIRNTSNNNNLSTATGAVEIDDTLAVLATSSAQSAFTINQNGSGSLISASTSDVAKFTVDNSGNLSLTGGNFSQTGSTTFSTGTGAVSLNGDATVASGKDLIVTSGVTSLTSGTTTSNALSLADTALTSGTLANLTLTSNAGNGQTTIGQSIALTDSTTAGGGYTALSVSTSGSGTGSGNKYLLDLNPGTNKEVVFDSSGAFRPTTAVASNTNTIGSPSFYWKTGYFDTVTANTLAGAISGGSTSSTSWTLGNSQTGDVNEALIFQRNSGSGNATLQWNAGTSDLRYLTANYPLNATYTVNDSSIGTGINLLSGDLTNNTTSGTQKLLYLSNTGTGTTEDGIYINNTGTGTTAFEIAGAWTNGILTNNNSINAGTAAITGGAVTGSSLTASGLSTAGVVTNSAAGLLGTLAGTTTTVLHGNASGAPTFASVSGSDLASDITISTTGNISTTGSGTITSAGLLTASNGLTLTTGALNLTGTSGSIALTGFGTTSVTSTTVSGNILTLADSSFSTTGANLANFTFTNTNSGAGAVTTNGVSITPTGTAITGGGSNTLNAINLPNVTPIASNTFNGINFGTGYDNLIKSANFTVTAAGTVTAVGVNSGTGLIQGTGGITVTGTGNINATLTAATNIGNSTGVLTLASGGASGWTNTSGDLTIQTATSGTMAIDSAGILNLGTTNSTATNLGKAATTLTINPTSWTATPTISGLITASGGVTLAANQNLTLNSGTGIYSQTFTGTTTNALAITANSLTSGNALNLSTSSTAALTGDALANLSVSGANGSGGITRYGLSSSVTSTGGTSTNVGLYSTASGATNNYAAIFDQGSVGINSTAPGAQLQVNTGSSSTVGQIIKGSTSQSVDLLQLKTSLDAVIAKVDQLGNLSANTLISTVSTGTAPLTVASTTVVSNLNVSQLQGYAASDLYSTDQPNLVLNSDFGRRNKWMTFMPETFSDTSDGMTVLTGSADQSVSANVLTPGTTDGTRWLAQEGLTTWKDARFSGQIKWNSGVAGIGKTFDVNNMVIATIESTAFSIWKRVGGTFTNVSTTAITPVAGNTYWVELEAQGTTYIAKFYSTGGTTYVAKSSATLSNTITATITDTGVASGGFGYWNQPAATNNFYGGLSTGDGGVYVEGWGPESWTVELNGTKGGQAIGFDETADIGPIQKQWAMRAYIPATSRNIEVYQDTPDGSVLASASYIASMYLNTSGKGGSGSLVRLQFQRMSSAIVQQGSTTADDNGETSWTRINSGAITTESGTRRARIRAHINASGTATGTAFFLLPQLEQGAIVTPWRNNPADFSDLVWDLQRKPSSSVALTNTASLAEVDPRDLAINTFLPYDMTLRYDIELSTVSKDASSTILYMLPGVDGNGGSQPYAIKRVVTTSIEGHLGSWTTELAAGKHRVTLQAIVDAATVTIGGGSAMRMIITATSNKGASNSNANDLAEEYSVNDPTIEAGDVVRISGNQGSLGSASVERTDRGYDPSAFGIISTAPAITFGNYDPLSGKIIDTSSTRWTTGTDHRPVALSGRVPVKVTNENGSIQRGDILTSSDKYPGYAMKATKAGRSIGIAMDDFILDSTIGNVQFGTIMTFVNLSWYDPDVYLTDAGQFVINKTQDIAQSPIDQVLGISSASSSAQVNSPKSSSAPNCEPTIDPSNFGLVTKCPENNLLTYIQNSQAAKYAYQVTDTAGNVMQRVAVLSEAVIGSLKAGAIDAKDIIADNLIINNSIKSPIAEVNIIRTDTITPLTSDKIVIKPSDISASSSAVVKPILEVQNASGSAVATIDTAGNATFSGTLNSFGLVTENASVSGTLRTKNLIADNIESQVAGIKSLIAGFSNSQASPSAQLGLQLSESESAVLAKVDTLQAEVGTFNQGLFVIGTSSFSNATVFGQLSIGATLTLADNSINVLGTDLKLQPLGQGGILLGKKIYIDTQGNLTTDGNMTVKGTLFAGLIAPIPGNDFIINLLNKNATESSKFVIKNASGSAVATIDGEGNAMFKKLNLSLISPAFALSEHEVLATGSAGVATISARQKELTIDNKLVTDKSLIYISPVGTPSAQIPFLLRQTGGVSFTVGTQDINSNELPFNWLIIN